MKLKIAIQKSGRLNAIPCNCLKIVVLLLTMERPVKATAAILGSALFANRDIPQYLRDGVVDIAIIKT